MRGAECGNRNEETGKPGMEVAAGTGMRVCNSPGKGEWIQCVTSTTSFRIGRALPWVLVILGSLAGAGSGFAQSGAPFHYYDSAIGKTGAPLKAALQSIIRNHTVIPYTSTLPDTWDALKVLDEDAANANDVILIYSGFSVLKSDQYNGTTGTWDREHLWPQSFGIVALNSNSRAKSDLFNLRPINVSINSTRGNKYFDYSLPPITYPPGAPGSSYDSNSWEPREADKGPIVRGLFYMAVRYDGSDADVPDLELSDSPNAAAYRFGKLTTLLAWHRQFAVGLPERQRNERIYLDYQHNRNPFIDHADYAEMVFNGVSPGVAWKDTNFTDAEISDPAIGGDAADPDHDGVSNLLEYVFNHDPRQPEASPVTAVSVMGSGGGLSLLVSFAHNRNATDVALTYEGSTDLATWTVAPSQVVSTVVTSSETEQITVLLLAPTSGYFVRIRATRTGP